MHTRWSRSMICGALVIAAGCAGSASARKPGDPDRPPAATARANQTPESAEMSGRVRGPVLAVGPEVPAERDIDAKLTVPRGELEREMKAVVGRSSAPFRRGKPESALGNLVAQVMKEQAEATTGRSVDMAFTNQGGLRSDLPAGPLTVGAISEVMPFDNELVVVELRGVELQEVLDRMALKGGEPVAGVVFRIDAGKATQVTVGGQPLDPARSYRVCTNDYVFDGGGKYEALKKARAVNRTGVLIRDAMLQYVQREESAGRVLSPVVDGRVSGSAPSARGE